jgi:2'-5' RNA ligase
MRAFIALELPKEIKDALAKLQEQLKASAADVKWVQPQNIHLTLKFLGEREDKKIKKISQILEDVAREKDAYTINISSLGAFPGLNSPRVIWVGVDKGEKETKEIAAALEEKIAEAGLPKEERPFSCHITLGRIRSGLNRERLVDKLKNLAQVHPEQAMEFQIKKITLFQSILTPAGPVYEILKTANLKAA